MTLTAKPVSRALALLGLLALAACGTKTEDTEVANLLLTRVKDRINQGPDGPVGRPIPLAPQQLAAMVAGADVPLAYMRLENTGSYAVLAQVGQNGPYRTYATALRQSFGFRDGLLVSTRGIGFDLMSSDHADLLAALRGPVGATASYSLHLLDGEERPLTLSFACTVTADPAEPLALVSAAGQRLASDTAQRSRRADCTGEDGTGFTDYYRLDAAGQIVAARQWIGPDNADVTVQQLRR